MDHNISYLLSQFIVFADFLYTFSKMKLKLKKKIYVFLFLIIHQSNHFNVSFLIKYFSPFNLIYILSHSRPVSEVKFVRYNLYNKLYIMNIITIE